MHPGLLPTEMEETSMSTDQATGHPDGQVIPLRAAEADTEVQLDEGRAAGAAYVDLTGGDAKRRPIVPAHWSSWENAKRHIAFALVRHGHRAAYHSVRSPAYFAKSLGFAVWGVVVTVRRLIRWWHIPGTTALEYQAAADGLLNDHLRLHQKGKETRKAARHDPRALPGWPDRRGRGHGGVRAAVAVGAGRCRTVRDVRAGRAPAGQDNHHPRRAARAGAAAGPGRDHPRAGVDRYRRDQPGTAQR